MSYTILYERKKKIRDIDNSGSHLSLEQSLLKHLNGSSTPKLPQLQSMGQKGNQTKVILEEAAEAYDLVNDLNNNNNNNYNNFNENQAKKSTLPSYSNYASYKFYMNTKKPNKIKASSKIDSLTIEEVYKDNLFERYIAMLNIDQEVVYLGCSFMGIYLRGHRESMRRLKESRNENSLPEGKGRKLNELPHIANKLRSGTQYSSNNLLYLSKAQFSKNSFFLKASTDEEGIVSKSQPDLGTSRALSMGKNNSQFKSYSSAPTSKKGREQLDTLVEVSNLDINTSSANNNENGGSPNNDFALFGIDFPEFNLKSFKANLLCEPNLE